MADPTDVSSPESGLANLSRSIRGLLARLTGADSDPTNPVINPATNPPQHYWRKLVSDILSQSGRLGENVGLLSSLVDTKLFKEGLADDKQYQIEQILQLCASLPPDSKGLDDLTAELVKGLWESLEHPPLSYRGDAYQYRTANGSNNNIKYPQLGMADTPYARTVTPQTLQPGVLPDPALIFDALYARGEVAREHPNKISSMLFYLATIIIHDIFHTDETDPSKTRTSSYLDLAPLYGNNIVEQKKVRLGVDGLLEPDTFSESRLLGFPPGVSALVVCFNRYHNYVAMQLKEINEGGRFNPPKNQSDEKGKKKLDEDLFQTARLVTCGLYINIILIDYVRTILNLNRVDSTWTLDPRRSFLDAFDDAGVPSGIGNMVSVEFNLIYRWHSAISVKDEQWAIGLFHELFPDKKIEDVTEDDLLEKMRGMSKEADPSKWPLGQYKRNARGAFEDKDLVKVLSDATEDVAGAFGPRNVPVVMKVVETLGIRQAREWQVCTLNEFRKFFKLEPHKEFSDISKDPEVTAALKTLYGHPDYVELYPGLVAEDAKMPLEPGSGLCPGFTTSRAILSDAVALTRGDRFYTVDYSPANLTNWGWNQVRSDKDVAGGGCIYNLLTRALPFWYRGNSVYAMFPFVVPNENRKILEKLNKAQDYTFDRPSYIGVPTPVKTWKGVTSVLGDQARFRVPWGDHTFYLTGHNFMLSGDGPKEAVQKSEVMAAVYSPAQALDEFRKFYEDLTTQLITANSEILRGDLFLLDAVRDVGNQSHAVFVSRMFHLPLKEQGDLKVGVTVDQLYLGMAILFAYVFLDLDTARSFKLRSAAKTITEGFGKLIKIVCEAVAVGKTLHLNSLFSMISSGKLLQDYGTHLISRLFDGGKSVDEVVWTIIPTAAAAVATQAQHFAQMLDLYLRPEYKEHWSAIQDLAWSDKPEDFEMLKGYALEANRLAPAAFGLLRRVNVECDIQDGEKKVHVKVDEQIYTDFITAGLDPDVFPEPEKIIPTRDRSLYLHHGWGPHKCVGRGIVEVSMAAQLKVFAKLKNLKRAPGLQGELKKTMPTPNPVSSDPQPSPGKIEVYMKEDWSDWWPFPASMKVTHEGFVESQEESLRGDTGVPNVEMRIKESAMTKTGKKKKKPSTA